MKRDRHPRVSELFRKAAGLPLHKRRRFLETECADQPDLLSQVESLLDSEETGAGPFPSDDTTDPPPPATPAGGHPAGPDDAIPPPARPAGAGAHPSGTDPEPVQAGLMLSHYRLVSKIGEGGMGVVWRAKDTILHRDVAIKVLPAALVGDSRRRDQFLQEARLASTVGDAHIVQVYEFGHEHGLDFLVMEYVDGRPLSEILDGSPLPPHKVADYGYQVAHALSRAHRKKLLHRDLKPSNILITPDNEVKVVDFGLAILFGPPPSTVSTRSIEDPSTELSDRVVAGTLPYMSPEQTRGEALDARSDIFSLGTVLYEMTTGQRPFAGETPKQIRDQIMRARPRPPHTLVPEIPTDLEWILRKILSFRRGDRYQTMGDLAVDLKRLGRDLDAGTAHWFGKLPPELKRRPWLGVGLSAVLMLLATAAVLWMLNPPPPAPGAPPPLSSPADVWYQRGLDYYHRIDEAPRNLDYAIQMFHRAVDDDPDLAVGWARLGETSWMRYDDTREASWREEAVKAVQTAFRIHPGLPEAHLARGYGLYLEGSFEDATAELQAAVDARPGLARAWLVLGQTYQARSDYADSRAAFEKAIELRPDEYTYHLWLGYFFKEFSEYDAAISAFKKACDLKPDSTRVWNSLAGALMPLRRFAEARDALLRSVDIEETGTTRDLIGTLSYFLEDYEDAVENYRRSTVLEPELATHWANLGDALKMLDRQDEAQSAYAEAVRLAQKEATQKPLDSEGRMKLGLYCARAGQAECAIREGNLAEALQPQSAQVLFRVAIIYCLVGQDDKALDRLEKAVRLGLSKVEIESDPDLSTLADNPRYKRILELAS